MVWTSHPEWITSIVNWAKKCEADIQNKEMLPLANTNLLESDALEFKLKNMSRGFTGKVPLLRNGRLWLRFPMGNCGRILHWELKND